MGRVVVEVSFPLLVGWLTGATTGPRWLPKPIPGGLCYGRKHIPIDSYSSAAFIHTWLHNLLLFSHSYAADEIFSAWHLSSSSGSKFSRRLSRNGPLSPAASTLCVATTDFLLQAQQQTQGTKCWDSRLNPRSFRRCEYLSESSIPSSAIIRSYPPLFPRVPTLIETILGRTYTPARDSWTGITWTICLPAEASRSTVRKCQQMFGFY